MLNNIIIDGLSFALPLLIIAIGGIYSERSGITNLALEGLLGFGAFCGGLFMAFFSSHFAAANVPVYLSLLIASIGGTIYAALFATLCIVFKANQVISGVVINILSVALTGFLTRQINQNFFNQPSDKFQIGVFPRTSIPVLKDIPVLGGFFNNFYLFEVIILILLAITWYLLYKTRFGMHLRACGDNPQSVDAAGIDVNKVRFKAVLISGALSGIGGMCFAYSISANFSPTIYMGAGFLAIAALIFGNWRIMPTFVACLIFGFARSAGNEIGKAMQLSSSFFDLTMTLPYVLTLLLLIFFSDTNRAPRALGEIYDKGKR
ncbi:MAG: ABC transporter permease [Clostridiaceae bacterium]|nr:ABC transporter permease [Clostridiaceae bacterium]